MATQDTQPQANKDLKENKSLKDLIAEQAFSDVNKCALDSVDFYMRVENILERTYIAMGQTKTYHEINGSTTHGKLNTQNFGSTNQI